MIFQVKLRCDSFDTPMYKSKYMSKIKIDNKGFATLMALLVVISLVLVVSLSMVIIVINENQIDKNLVLSAQSYYSAESGLEDALLRVINSNDYNHPVNDLNLDDSVVSRNIVQDGNSTTIESISSHYNNKRKVEAELVITTSDISFHYGVQVGEGGVTMGNNSSIDGNLYSDGSVSGNGTIKGDLIVATGMDVDANGIWNTYNDDMIFGEDGKPTDIAMSFTPTSTGVLSQVSFYVKASSPIHGSGIIKIVEDDLGSPSSAVALATDTFLASKIGSSYGWVNFSFSTPTTLTGSVTYWIVIDLSSENSKHFSIGRGQWNANSVSKYIPWGGGPWEADALGDYEYKVWIGGLATSVTGLTIEGSVRAHEIVDSNIAGDAYAKVINSSDIVGDAHYGTITDSTVGGVEYADNPDDPPFVALPVSNSNIAEWKADALGYGILDSSLCDISTDTTINGGKLVCSGADGFNPTGNSTITLKGTLWVEGKITLGNNTILVLHNDYGDNSGIIIADNPGSESSDGKIVVENGTIICGSQGLNVTEDGCAESNGSYILMLSTHSGTDDSYAIEVKNNASGAIFYAHSGIAHVINGADLKEVTAHGLSLEETAKVTYESGLASASFTSGPGGGWAINNWKEIQ